MRRYIVTVLLLLFALLALIGCQDTTGFDPAATWRAQLDLTRQAQTPQFTSPAATETAANPTATEISVTTEPDTTQTVSPSEEPAATVTPTDTPVATPTRIAGPPDGLVNLFADPSFEGEATKRTFNEVQVIAGWEPFFCAVGYRDIKAGQCKNEEGHEMRRPEFRPSFLPERVRQGVQAQQWFCQFGACQAGVYQTVQVEPGRRCAVSAFVMTWSRGQPPEEDLARAVGGRQYWSEARQRWEYSSTPWTSDIAITGPGGVPVGDRLNSEWVIKVDPAGGSDAFAEGLIVSQAYTYADGHYDQFGKIYLEFISTGAQATIFFENLRHYRLVNNDSYIDSAFVGCY